MSARKRGRPTYGGYVYPLPAGEWTDGRIDQGVDFVNKSASSRILAIGNAKILSTGAPGWPGEGGVLYQLLDGPKQGSVVFVYENVKPHVRAGQTVRAGQVIATMKGTGYPWVEMGWADTSGVPISHAEYTEGKETVGGKSMRHFLDQLKKGGSRSAYAGMSPAERKRYEEIAEHENLGSGIADVVPGVHTVENAAGDAANAVADGLASLLSDHAEAFMLNVGLVGGGAFLVYYGAALMLGVKQPAKAIIQSAQTAAAVAPK